jgi:hypothetical protein
MLVADEGSYSLYSWYVEEFYAVASAPYAH